MRHTSLLILLLSFGLGHLNAQCAPTTTVITQVTFPIKDTTINAYYPGIGAAPVGATSIVLGPKRGGDPIQAGDLVAVYQVQGADIDTTLPDDVVNGNYGDGPGGLDRAGQIANGAFTAGAFEYAVAANAVPNAGGVLNITAPLQFGFLTSFDIDTSGSRTFQVIRVPVYTDVDIPAGAQISAIPWDGRTGGLLMFDVQNQLTLNGTLNSSFIGFRGAGKDTSETVSGRPGFRGEGIAGTPRIIYDGETLLNNLADQSTSLYDYTTYAGVSHYPGSPAGGNTASDLGYGAPGNAGGSGTGDNGGGGGGNGGRGGLGSTSNASQSRAQGGAQMPNSYNRMFMGGGGGSGAREDDLGDVEDGSAGQPGGGIVRVTCNTFVGTTGTILAEGNDGSPQTSEGCGGGGAGGTVVFTTNSTDLSGLSIDASGGFGGQTATTSDGPGGGGGGGYVILNNPAGTFTNLPTINIDGGTVSVPPNGNVNPSEPGQGGTSFSISVTLCPQVLSFANPEIFIEEENSNGNVVTLSDAASNPYSSEWYVNERRVYSDNRYYLSLPFSSKDLEVYNVVTTIDGERLKSNTLIIPGNEELFELINTPESSHIEIKRIGSETIEIYNAVGQLVSTVQGNRVGKSSLNPGAYVLRTKVNGVAKTYKFTIN